ncbi:MAG TPA: hypothetical protein VG324_16115 [Blastocatellia bacterium]|nr:hypothetical protein [Blastocatellia bacterium]
MKSGRRKRIVNAFLALFFGGFLSSEVCPQVSRAQEMNIRPRFAMQQEAADFSKRLLKRLQQTKDLGKLLDEFSNSNPRRIFPRAFDRTVEDAQLKKSISGEEWDKYCIALFNLTFMLGVHFIGIGGMEDDRIIFETAFPPAILRKLKRNPYLSSLPEKKFSPEIQSLRRLRDITQALDPVIVEFRAYLNSHASEWQPKYESALAELDRTSRVRDEAIVENCSGADCFGKLKGTQVVHVVMLYFALTLVKEQGRLKILAIDPMTW